MEWLLIATEELTVGSDVLAKALGRLVIVNAGFQMDSDGLVIATGVIAKEGFKKKKHQKV